QLVPGDFAKKTALFTSGSEAVENAVKVARAHTKRSGVIAFTSGYHGRTMAALALTGKVAPYSKGMGLMSANVFRAEFPCALHGVSDDDAIASIERIFKNDAEPDDIAAIIIEPVQGEGGFYHTSVAFMQQLRQLCDKHGIMLIADEVQTGAGRTGTFFAMEQMGVAADITTFAKSIAGGFPLSGITGSAEVMDSIGAGGLGGTYGGSPLACAAALAVIEVFEEEKLLQRANALGAKLKASLKAMAEAHQQIVDVRGLGAMIAVELMQDGKPAPEYCAQML
ncbi:aminotransferase class III-fold pyridoxal phosphate-dependent enzyme, partial [Shewanella sp. 0m-11]